MDWDRDLPGWPLAHLSRRLTVSPHRWHLQESGQGETILLLHGAGASTHSWRDLIPVLAKTHHVVAIDLPGQGFTRMGTRRRCGLKPMAEDIAALCTSCGWKPVAIVGHSAGVAIALRLSQLLGARSIVGFNPALGNFEGLAGWLFPLFARVLANAPLTASLFTLGGVSLSRARALIERTGSNIGEDGLTCYARLIADRDHVDATLQMMAQWSLEGLLDDMPDITARCLFVTGSNDRAVPPRVAADAARRLPDARVMTVEGAGHLVHEERPAQMAEACLIHLSR